MKTIVKICLLGIIATGLVANYGCKPKNANSTVSGDAASKAYVALLVSTMNFTILYLVDLVVRLAAVWFAFWSLVASNTCILQLTQKKDMGL
jgi:hypothetical protein